MKMLILLLPLFSLAFFSVGCKKENAKHSNSNQDSEAAKHYLVDTLVGNYQMSGSSYNWAYTDSSTPNASDFTTISNVIFTLSKVDDSTLMVTNGDSMLILSNSGITVRVYQNSVTPWPGTPYGPYTFFNYYTPTYVQLNFDSTNLNRLQIQYGIDALAHGTSTVLSGTKVP